ncbi:hypothetical protein SS50377_26673 [Spironucleus salmonicida]|uniref:Raptor N-terminal CASPase-like domain-containing protein n=1 Tax=Spironucleus salmonicida TaxID=348837 RepID=V6LX33_9EUKA|nr:hypothetical protein SS50377_26673 [Spironucleus salmonicida]|eukprot:EST49150.1 hypothetical protein SS50377_10362 [Spironucleus salmonicida]
MNQISRSYNQIYQAYDDVNKEYTVNYYQFIYSQPLQRLLKQPLKKHILQGVQEKVQAATVISSFELTKDLLSSYWVEAGIEMLNQPLENLSVILNKGVQDYYGGFKKLAFKQLPKQTYQDLRKFSQSFNSNILLHYISRNTSLQLSDCIILQTDECKAQPIIITDIIKSIGRRTVFIFDCNFAGNLIQKIRQEDMNDVLAFGATSIDQTLPYLRSQKRLCPTDIFTLTMTTPLLGLFISFIQRFQSQTNQSQYNTFMQVYQLYQKIQNQNDFKQIQLIMDAICENIAFSALNRSDYQTYYNSNSFNSGLIRNYLVAQRVLSSFNIKTSCSLNISDSSKDPLWSSFDAVLHKAVRFEKDILFIEQQLDAFNLQISFSHSHPTNLPIVIHLLKDQTYYLKAYQLISKYIDYSNENLEEVIFLGLGHKLMNRIIKVQKLVENELFQEIFRNIVFILSKMIQNSTQSIHDFIVFANENKIPFQFEEFILKQLTKPQTPIEVRLYIVQILTILTSNNIQMCLQDETILYVSQYVINLRQNLYQNGSLVILQTLLQSSSSQLRVWTLLLFGNLGQEVVIRQDQTITTIKQGKSFGNINTAQQQGSKDYLVLYNDIQIWEDVQKLLGILIISGKCDNSVEVRAAALQAIYLLLPDFLKSNNEYQINFLSKENEDILQHSIAQSFIQLICKYLIDESSPLIRFQSLQIINKIILSKLKSVISYFGRPQSDDSFLNNDDICSKEILHALFTAQSDPQIIISKMAKNLFNNLSGFSTLYQNQQEQGLQIKCMMMTKYEIQEAQFTQLVTLVSQQNVSLNNISAIFDSKFIKIDVGSQQQPSASPISLGQSSLMKSREFKRSFTDFNQSTNHQSKQSLAPESQLVEYDQSSSLSEDYKPIVRRQRTIKGITFKTSELPAIQITDDKLVVDQEEKKNVNINNKDEDYYKQVYESTITIQEDIHIFQNLSNIFFNNLLFSQFQDVCSPIFNLAIRSISQPNIFSNVLAQSVQLATTQKKIIRGCPTHNTLSILQDGVFSTRPSPSHCQICSNISLSSIDAQLKKQDIETQRHIFNITNSQKEELFALDLKQDKQFSINQLITSLENVQQVTSEQQNVKSLSGCNAQIKNLKQLEMNYKKYINFEKYCASLQLQQCIVNVCQSYMFSLPCDLAQHYMVQNGSPITIMQQLSESVLKVRTQQYQAAKRFDYESMLSLILKPTLSTINCALSDGKIFQQFNQNYNTSKSQKLFQNPIQHIQSFSQQNLSIYQDEMSNLIPIDHSCDMCRRIAVKTPLLQHCSILMSKENKKDNKVLVYFEPTRDVKVLYRDRALQGQLLGKKDYSGQLINQQMIIKQYQQNLTAPFPELEQMFYCNPQFSKKYHSIFGRSLYRIIYQNKDNLINFHIVQNDNFIKQRSRVQSAAQLQKVDSQSSFCSEYESVATDLEYHYQNNTIKKQLKINNRFCGLGMLNQQKKQSSIQLIGQISSNLSEENYVQCSSVQDLQIQDQYKANFKQQFNYLQRLTNIQKYQTNQKFKLFWQFQVDSGVKMVKFHPTLNYLIIIYQNKIQIFSVLQKLSINEIDPQQIRGDYQAQLFYFKQSHNHNDIPKNNQSLYQFVKTKSNNVYSHYASYIRDLETCSQNCYLCKLIQKNQYYSTTDIDNNCQKLLNNSQDINIFDNQLCTISKNNFDMQIFDTNFINTNTTFQLMGIQELDGKYSILSNPYSVNNTRQISSFRPFIKEQQLDFNWKSALPVFDLYAKIQTEKNNINLVKSRTDIYLRNYQLQSQLQQHQNSYMVDQLDNMSIFSQNELKIYDILSDRQVFSCNLPDKAISQSITQNLIAVTGKGFTHVYDRRSELIVQNETKSFKFIKLLDNKLFKIDDTGTVFDGNNIISQYKVKPKGLLQNYFYDISGSLYNLSSFRINKQKIEAQNICYSQDSQFICSWDSSGKISVYQNE